MLTERREQHRRVRFANIAFSAALVAALAWEVVALFAPTSGIRAAGRRSYVIRELAAGVAVGQTFRILDDYLESVDLRLSATQPAGLTLACRLLEQARYGPNSSVGSGMSVREWKTTLQLPRGTSTQHFTFQPIARSAKHIYEFQVEQLAVQPLEGTQTGRPIVGVLASRDDSLAEGNVMIGLTQVVERDLFLQARTANRYTQFRLQANPQLPRSLRQRSVQLGLLAIYNWALAVFAYQMIVRGPEQDLA